MRIIILAVAAWVHLAAASGTSPRHRPLLRKVSITLLDERRTGLQRDQQEHQIETQVAALAVHTGDRRPVLTVHLMNGLGNQLFQVAALVATALNDGGFAVSLPNISSVCCNRSTYWNNIMAKLGPLLQSHSGKNRTSNHLPPKGNCLLEQAPGLDPWSPNCGGTFPPSSNWTSKLQAAHHCQTTTLYGHFQNGVLLASFATAAAALLE